MRLIVPRAGGRRRRRKVPRMRMIRQGARQEQRRPPAVSAREEAWEGEGPWYYDGKQASRPEARVLNILLELGWTPAFQVNKFGGRTYPGGQVLDILLTQRQPVIYIDIRSYWHMGARGEANDARKTMQLRASAPNVKIVVIWEEQTEDRDLLYARLLREVGARGR